MSFSATEAAFEGFRIVRRNPLALVWWAGLYSVLSLASLAAMSLSADAWIGFIQMSEEVERSAAGGQPDPEQVMAMLGAMGQAMVNFIWLFPLQIAVTAVLTAAIARAVVRPSERAFGYMRFSADEARVFAVTLVVTLALGAIYLACIFAVAILMAIVGAVETAFMGLAMLVGFVGTICLLVWLAVRWSLAVPITVAERRIAFFDSFRVTRGHFWPLLGMAILAGIMAAVIALLAMIVILPLSLMSGASMFGGMTSNDPAAMFEIYRTMNPWMIVTALLNAVVYALAVGVVYAPFSAAYRDIKGLPHEG
jgi:hypothetical protein